MKRIFKIILIVLVIVTILSGLTYGSFKVYRYLQEKQKNEALYVSIPMKLDYANTYPDFYIGREDLELINLEGMVSEKQKILHILQVSDANYINTKYLRKYKKGETNMTASVNKPISEVNNENDLLLKSVVVSEIFSLYNFDDVLINRDGIECPSVYDQKVFFMQNFTNQGKSNKALESLLPVAVNALNKGDYLVLYDKMYYKTAKYPRYIPETDSFEVSDNKLTITDFNYLTNGNIDDYLMPLLSNYPFYLTNEIISDDDLFLDYAVKKELYTIRFKINPNAIDSDYAENYFFDFLDFPNGVLSSYSCEVEIWDNGLIKSIVEYHHWNVIYDTGLRVVLHMDLPLNSYTYFSYKQEEADVIKRLEFMTKN